MGPLSFGSVSTSTTAGPAARARVRERAIELLEPRHGEPHAPKPARYAARSGPARLVAG